MQAQPLCALEAQRDEIIAEMERLQSDDRPQWQHTDDDVHFSFHKYGCSNIKFASLCYRILWSIFRFINTVGQPQLKQEFLPINVPPPLDFPPMKRQRIPHEIPSLESVSSGMANQRKTRIPRNISANMNLLYPRYEKNRNEPTSSPSR